MRRKFTVYGLRFSKTSFWNRINTGFLDPAVATVLTACGIETVHSYDELAQHLLIVATVLTACGIETYSFLRLVAIKLLKGCNSAYRLRYWNTPPWIKGGGANFGRVATVLTACGIETLYHVHYIWSNYTLVATVLTACGIETWLKILCSIISNWALQQCLPLAVLKLEEFDECRIFRHRVATVLTACGIETYFVLSTI